MNQTEITTDGVCVYVHTKMVASKTIKKFVKVALGALVIGLLLIILNPKDSDANIFGLLLLLSGFVAVVPMGRTIFWNLHGEEFFSISTKSVVQEVSYGFIKMPPTTFLYNQKLRFQIEILKEDENIKEGRFHLYAYDQHNQPFHLFQTHAYLTEHDCLDIVSKVQLIFALDNEFITEYSAN